MLDSKLKRTMKCMMIGSLIYNIVLFIASLIVILLICRAKNLSNSETITYVVKSEVSLLIGFICCIVGLYSMAVSLSKAISANDEKYAKKHVALMRSIRLIVFCVLQIIIINEKVFGLSGGIMFALAVLGIKAGAYLVPIIEKYIE